MEGVSKEKRKAGNQESNHMFCFLIHGFLPSCLPHSDPRLFFLGFLAPWRFNADVNQPRFPR
ncbi:MAG: hypothetical protein AAGL98_09520, partial [Planctomycetota bacterium]